MHKMSSKLHRIGKAVGCCNGGFCFNLDDPALRQPRTGRTLRAKATAAAGTNWDDRARHSFLSNRCFYRSNQFGGDAQDNTMVGTTVLRRKAMRGHMMRDSEPACLIVQSDKIDGKCIFDPKTVPRPPFRARHMNIGKRRLTSPSVAFGNLPRPVEPQHAKWQTARADPLQRC